MKAPEKQGLRPRAEISMLTLMFLRTCLVSLAAFFIGCLHVKMEPIQVNAVVDVNIKVDRALDDFFGELDRKSTTVIVSE